MGKVANRALTSCCTANGAVLNLRFDKSEIIEELKRCLAKQFLKKGVLVQWSEESSKVDFFVRIVAIDQGNQLLRYLLPFIAPAVLEVEGQVTTAGGALRTFHHVQRTHIGLFGGYGKGMLKVCARRMAKKIAADVLMAL